MASLCVICNKNKTSLTCDSCKDVACKTCVQFIDEDIYEFIVLLPDDLKFKTFCMNCYNQGIDERMESYQELAARAKEVAVYSRIQSKETRGIKRVEPPLQVIDCDDREEALLRLAFMTAEKGFSTLVDVEIVARKFGEGKSYKKKLFTGSGVPVDPSIRK